MYDPIFASDIKENQMIWSIIVMLDNQKEKIIHMHFVKNLYIKGEFHAWDNCTSMGISVIFYPCKQIKLY